MHVCVRARAHASCVRLACALAFVGVCDVLQQGMQVGSGRGAHRRRGEPAHVMPVCLCVRARVLHVSVLVCLLLGAAAWLCPGVCGVCGDACLGHGVVDCVQVRWRRPLAELSKHPDFLQAKHL